LTSDPASLPKIQSPNSIGIAIGARSATPVYGMPNGVSNMKASIQLFGQANDRENRRGADRDAPDGLPNSYMGHGEATVRR
jgi:hypothetical protein